jgi:hypothetical protein
VASKSYLSFKSLELIGILGSIIKGTILALYLSIPDNLKLVYRDFLERSLVGFY